MGCLANCCSNMHESTENYLLKHVPMRISCHRRACQKGDPQRMLNVILMLIFMTRTPLFRLTLEHLSTLTCLQFLSQRMACAKSVGQISLLMKPDLSSSLLRMIGGIARGPVLQQRKCWKL